jgi:DNA recombination protein RmuC
MQDKAVDSDNLNLGPDNTRQLDRMRETVDEKLQGTLEKRLGESFKQVSERLELVHQGLGDMRNLAAGVGDLKKVLTNIKTRGTWGEVQLGALLEEILAPEQYARNVRIQEHSSEAVDFAIKLPGQGDSSDHVLIPVDAKFPVEDYQRLLDAQENADAVAAEDASRLLETRIKNEAKDIFKKYIAPPRTTDFGIMFLPSEGLYAEIIRRTALVQILQREYHIVVSGPSTFAAFLNSLQMGFRSLAIQKRSGEVWKVLGEIKTEFDKFGLTLDAVRKKLEQATNSMDDVQKKSRTIQRRLRSVQELPGVSPEAALDDKAPLELDES